MTFSIDGRSIGPKHSPYIIAELSANHNGDLGRALETISAAQQCGADAVKLQTYTADTMTIDSDRPEFQITDGPWSGYKLYDLYKWAQTPFEWHHAMIEHARKCGMTVFSTPFDESAVDLLETLEVPAYKVASFEVTDLPLVEYISSKQKPVILSSGMASEDELDEAVTTAREAGCEDLVLLHCISSYPAPISQANLRQLPELARRFNTIPGLSDHTLGTAASVAAVALGACVIEKHFTLSRAEKGPDSEFSLEPQEFETLCRDARDAWLALGSAGYGRQKAEEGSKLFRRSIYFVRDVARGEKIKPDDIRRIRPSAGLAPRYFRHLLGKRVNVDVQRGTPASWDFFDE